MEKIEIRNTELGKSKNIKEHKPYKHTEFIIQALENDIWVDVLYSRGDSITANKKAKHYRNKYQKQTRVIEIEETITYTYHYYITDTYTLLNQDLEKKEK